MIEKSSSIVSLEIGIFYKSLGGGSFDEKHLFFLLILADLEELMSHIALYLIDIESFKILFPLIGMSYIMKLGIVSRKSIANN